MKDHRLFRQDSGSGSVPPPPPPPPSGINTGASESASTNSIIALVLGILSWVACGILTAIPAWIMGKGEINKINAGHSPQAGKTMATIGMWLGIVNVILWILVIIFVILYFLIVGVFIFSQ
ncbi:DUF4190 domain-containing protein [Bacteroidota bacterium]